MASLVAKYPKITEIIIDSLIECLKTISKNRKLREVNNDHVIKTPISIKEWNKNKHKRIEDKINKTLIEYNIKNKEHEKKITQKK